MLQGKKLVHYIGKNVKTKVVNLRLLLLFYRNAILEMDSQAADNHWFPAGDREAAAALVRHAGQRTSAVRGEKEPHAGWVQAEVRTQGMMV